MWDVVDSNFDTGEETANFGPRQESGTALYQIETFATVSSREKSVCESNVNSTIFLIFLSSGFAVNFQGQNEMFLILCP